MLQLNDLACRNQNLGQPNKQILGEKKKNLEKLQNLSVSVQDPYKRFAW